MESKLNISEFRAKLKNSTKIGHPKLKLSPFGIFSMFGEFSKKFYGFFDDSTFYLTRNFRVSQTPFIIKGNYKTINRELRVQYKIEPRYKYQHLWRRFVSIFGFTIFNISIFSNPKGFQIETFIMVNIFLLFMVSYGYWNIVQGKKKLEKSFIELFEIKEK